MRGEKNIGRPEKEKHVRKTEAAKKENFMGMAYSRLKRGGVVLGSS